jgi:hypothetical protein
MIAKFVDHGQGIIDIHLKIDRILIIFYDNEASPTRLQLGDSIFAIFRTSAPRMVREE